MSPKRYAINTIIDSNIIWCDDGAQISIATSYIRGIDVVFSRGYRVTNNIVANWQTSTSADYSMRIGFSNTEYQSTDGVISGNSFLHMLLNGLEMGLDATADLRRISVKSNYIYDCIDQGMSFNHCFEALTVSENVIDSCGQDGIFLGTTTTADSVISDNTLRHCGIQPTYCTFSGIKVEGINAVVENNTLEFGHINILVTSAAVTPKVRVQASNLTIYLQESGVDVASTSYASMTFGQVAEWIRLRANWNATLFTQPATAYSGVTPYTANTVVTNGGLVYRCVLNTTGNAPPNPTYWEAMSDLGVLPAAKYLRRTGPRTSDTELNYVVPANGLNLCSYEPEVAVYFAYTSNGNCVAKNNTLKTYADKFGTDSFYLGLPFFWEKADSIADVTNSGTLQNSQSTAYTCVRADANKQLLHPTTDASARTFTIDSNANVPYPVGTTLTFINEHGAGVLSIAITTDAMYLSPGGSTGTRSLAANGYATALKVASAEWIISGTGLT